MVYCTKEWLTQALLSNLDKTVKVDVRAEKRDNAFYKTVEERIELEQNRALIMPLAEEHAKVALIYSFDETLRKKMFRVECSQE